MNSFLSCQWKVLSKIRIHLQQKKTLNENQNLFLIAQQFDDIFRLFTKQLRWQADLLCNYCFSMISSASLCSGLLIKCVIENMQPKFFKTSSAPASSLKRCPWSKASTLNGKPLIINQVVSPLPVCFILKFRVLSSPFSCIQPQEWAVSMG